MRRLVALVATGLVAIAGVTACSSSSGGGSKSSANDITALARPKEGSVEAGFARDMSVHHAQAVAMAEAIRDRTTDPDLKLLATDIALGQQGQIGRMSGWLDEWGLNQTSTATPMAWIRSDNLVSGSGGGMDMGGATMTLTPDGLMPGMATRPQVTALGTLPIAQAEISFLQLMIAHHTAGVEMAQAALARTNRPDVIRLATSIINGQQAEITVMTDMLAKRGATP
ncbi:MAG: hypothetical protein JWL72_1560 [Ilumatobacteraceae bacterium]|nr:hypothetical protein [Ilumatobacteraceae bacterium]MCU1388222.1 hypothetical protein [Ilumatobacteraceae bacterium]